MDKNLCWNIDLHRMDHAKCASDFLRGLREGLDKGFEDFTLRMSNVSTTYPNAVVPIAGIIAHLRKQNVDFDFEDTPSYLERAAFENPLQVSLNENTLRRAPLDNVWHFKDAEEISLLVNAIVHEVSQLAVCESGVLEGLNWCLNEVMDNVIQHSGVQEGYVMGQIHRTTKHIAICIFDPGQGIYNSLRNTKHTPRHPVDAITLAIKEGVTRDKKIGQGNGMWGLHNIVKSNSGKLVITSNGASYMLDRDDIKTFRNLPYFSRTSGFTTIDFQIDFDKGISIAEALGGHTPISLRLEELENDIGNLQYRLSEKSSGTGTRQSGERIRNEIVNLFRETGKVIEIDFTGVSVISSSFADELIGKIVAEFGFAGFNQVFRLRNMNNVVQPIVDRSVLQRLVETFRSSTQD